MVVNVKMYVIMGRLLHLQVFDIFKPEPEALIKSTQRNLKLKVGEPILNILAT